jgi:hypothetical protein
MLDHQPNKLLNTHSWNKLTTKSYRVLTKIPQ